MSVGAELRMYLQVLWRRKWVIAVCTVAALGATLLFSALSTPLYKATATLRVASAPGAQVDEAWIDSALATRMLNTYVEIATSDPVLEELAARLGLGAPPVVEPRVVPETELIEITVWNRSASLASSAANTLAGLMAERSLQLYGGDVVTARSVLEDQLENSRAALAAAMRSYVQSLSGRATEEELAAVGRLVSLRQDAYVDALGRYESAQVRETLRTNAISIMELSSVPARPSRPNIPFNGVLGVACGLTVGVLAAFLLESLDTTIGGPDQVEALTPLPVLARVPELPRRALSWRGPGRLRNDGGILSAGGYHRVLAWLSSASPSPVSVVLITSPEPGAGKSTIAVQLSLALAESGRRVMLVDANLRRPVLQRFFGMADTPGLAAILTGETPFGPDNPGQETVPGLRVLVAGAPRSDPRALFTVANVEGLLHALATECDHVVIDSPAMLSADECSLLASNADAVLLVVAQRRTNADHLRLAAEQLAEMHNGLVGVVVNRTTSFLPHGY